MNLARLLTILILIPLGTILANQVEDDLAPFEGKIIKNITIIRKNVFENTENEKLPFYFRWANKLHIRTRRSVIAGELLFKTGEPLEIDKIIESARNIRFRRFIGEVFIIAAPNGGDGVDITVTTIDNWTTKLALVLEKGGGDYIIGASMAEDNLFGYGRFVQLAGSVSDDNEGYTVFFGDDRIGRTRWAGSFLFSDFTLSRSVLLSLAKPQYSLDTRFGISSRFLGVDGVSRLYSGGDEFFRYKRTFNNLAVNAIYSIGREKRINILGSYNYEDLDYSPYYENFHVYDHLIPSSETRSYPSAGVGASIIKYDLGRYLDEAGTPEDLTLGGSTSLAIGRSLPQFGADYIGTAFAANASFLVKPFKKVFIGGRENVNWWYHKGARELISYKTEAVLYVKTVNTQVLAVRGVSNFAWRQRPGYQVILGGTNGLRGYSSFSFEGQKSALGNMEYRFYIPLEILTVRVGGVMFFDIGNVWSEGEEITLNNMKSNIGIGLRLGLTKSSTARVLRFDIAKALTENDYYISFGTGVLFSLSSITGHD